MIRQISDFITTLESERDKTIAVFKAVDEKKKTVKLHENLRSLERMAWHITQSITEMPHKTGLLEQDDLADSPIPDTFAQIVDQYNKHSLLLSETIQKKWTDNDLNTEVDMYGEKWKNGTTLFILITHEVHHRGEMMAVMRALGMTVPGIYGPAKEDWAKFGMPAAE